MTDSHLNLDPNVNQNKKQHKELNNGLGVFGGSFDPIHLGHTQSAQAVANELNLKQVLIIPAYISPLKNTPALLPHANTKQRVEMIDTVCRDNELFSCDTREIKRLGNSYTVDTLRELKNEYPEQTLYFIIGMDSLINFTKWHQYQEILELCHLVVNTRPQHDMTQLDTTTKALLGKHLTHDKKVLSSTGSGCIFFAKPLFYDISSTHIRQLIALKKTYKQLVHPKISEYIDKNKLYR